MSPSSMPQTSPLKSAGIISPKHTRRINSSYNLNLPDGMLEVAASLETILLKDCIRKYEALLANKNVDPEDLKDHWEAILIRVQGVELRKEEMERRRIRFVGSNDFLGVLRGQSGKRERSEVGWVRRIRTHAGEMNS
ncbi:MAG: hypothetical protein MMC33_005825 [Icmadophila ericetorum]|nr:hypothetical protein [Icmadophila ericetorum]